MTNNNDNPLVSVSNKKILIVDDIPKNLQVLGNILDREGVDISFATNGKQAIDLVAYNKPDLILLDISMPELDGFEVCEILKKKEETREIPIIFLTARTETESIVQGFKTGGQDYITKPFNPEELLARVRTHLELKDKKEAVQLQAQQLMTANEEQRQLNEYLEHQKNLISQKNKYLTDSIKYAQIIQNSLLSSVETIKSVFENSFIIYKPKDIVSGDFYYFEKLRREVDPENNSILLIAADCTGHGVPGALLTMLGITLLNQIVVYERNSNPALILQKLNDEINSMLVNKEHAERSGDGMDVAACKIDLNESELTFCGAKRPIYLIQNNEFFEYHGNIHSIGGFYDNEVKYFDNQTIKLNKGDWIYMTSDGFVSQFGGDNDKKFNRRRFRELLLEIHQCDVKTQKSKIEEKFAHWKGNREQVDDIMIIGFKYEPE